MYEYVATVLRVVDGDTVDVDVDLGMHIHTQTRLRLAHINAPEHGTVSGDAATAYVKSVLPVGQTVVIQTQKDRQEKYGRYLAVVTIAGTLTTLNATMVEKGYAVPYEGGAR